MSRPGLGLSPQYLWKYSRNFFGSLVRVNGVVSGARFEPATYLPSDLLVCAEGAARVDCIQDSEESRLMAAAVPNHIRLRDMAPPVRENATI
jgi:hypothetical protein